MIDLATRLGDSVAMSNPVMTASGTGGFSTELNGYFEMRRLGAFVTKSLAHFATEGNPSPRAAGAGPAMLNSVGLAGPGIQAWRAEHAPLLARLGIPTFVSIWGRTVADYEKAVAQLSGLGDFAIGIEVNISCPNIEDRGKMFAHSPEVVAEVMDATAGADLPRTVKLSPNTHLILEVADVARAKGAAGAVLVNTAMGLGIDPGLLIPTLGAKGGGVSGPALHPIALRAVYECHAAFPKFPLVGVGGVSTAREAIAMLAAGASAVQVGTASFVEPRAASRILAELPASMERLGFSRVSDLVGAAHRGGIAGTNR
ncbi:MAG: dihydroorotate dehydrogenase [Actinobacteria bacterium]|nr:dihydroorotate dehydrogenase [Actinomycetota bacterium]MDA8375433.1 dihydroorotate dehydrogenase [Actinomycetota bacterium]